LEREKFLAQVSQTGVAETGIAETAIAVAETGVAVAVGGQSVGGGQHRGVVNNGGGGGEDGAGSAQDGGLAPPPLHNGLSGLHGGQMGSPGLSHLGGVLDRLGSDPSVNRGDQRLGVEDGGDTGVDGGDRQAGVSSTEAKSIGDVSHLLELTISVNIGVGAGHAAVGVAHLLLGAVDVGVAVVQVAELVLGMELAACAVGCRGVGIGRSSCVRGSSSVGVGRGSSSVGVSRGSGIGVGWSSSTIGQRQTGVSAVGQGVGFHLLGGSQSQQAGNGDLKKRRHLVMLARGSREIINMAEGKIGKFK
jgi:hypothetical protein